jgi:L-cystine uptake protein TcyP (sodium:dicarboxylate symporter family)
MNNWILILILIIIIMALVGVLLFTLLRLSLKREKLQLEISEAKINQLHKKAKAVKNESKPDNINDLLSEFKSVKRGN